MSDGILIMHNDAYAYAAIRRSVITNNLGNGISTRGPFFEVEFCEVTENSLAGIEYNPYYTTYEGRQIRAGIHNPKVLNNLDDQIIRVENENYLFIITEEMTDPEPRVYEVHIQVQHDHNVVADILDYNPDVTQEKLRVYNSKPDRISTSTFHWEVEEDLVDFPVVSDGVDLTLRWNVISQSSGRLTLAIRSSMFCIY